ncbi:ExbD/TolR family protein [Pseudobacteriovorax antillogorgiicola]|uniref:Cell division and transport-associated protein TolR n=1 Tax=Pseudobacteriovorax antillogorgiicola TaxID=1513793 RepID=A0A1Y6BWZ5_9BACT|nr:biopolymer transporter ExbD [Pseudobacteriovorax antillogorgiicola]TCS50276.1 cell division and transport-associated protein TolR [Pseudobacteriovorax antillogorgiicola]SMF33561.1 Cell division and transport-associated protein TolR [Pseudobacteriovorax antillogorgiicola]
MDFKMDSGGDEVDEAMADINIVPLVDVMLVLLIIFMVTAPLSIGGIKVSLPTSKARSSSISEDRVVLSINQKGQYYIEKMEVTADALSSRLAAIYEHRQKKELYIRADKRVVYGKVVDAMSSAKVAGVGKISMLTEPPKGR